MKSLEEARIEINAIDAQLVELFEKRMKVVLDVAHYKAIHQLPIFDSAREKSNIEKNSALLKNPELKEYFVKWYQNTMDVSKEYQQAQLDCTESCSMF